MTPIPLSFSATHRTLRYTAAGLAAISLLIAAACEKPKAAAPAVPVVDVVTVAQRDVPIYMEWIGSLDGNINAVIRPQVTGYLIKQNYREGDLVKQGQPLFEIDPRTFEAAVDEAKGLRAQQAVAQYETTRANLARIKPLAAMNAVSQKDLDDATGADLSAKASLDAAEASLRTAKLNLAFTKITSPVTGIAGIAKAQIGDLLSPSMPTELTTVSTVDPIKVYFNISEREYLKVAGEPNGTSKPVPLELFLVDGSLYPHPGKFFVLNRQVDEHRHLQGGSAFPESPQPPAPRPVRQGAGNDGGREGCTARAAACGYRNPGQVPGGGRRRRQQGRHPSGHGRRAHRFGLDHQQGPAARRAGDRRGNAEGPPGNDRQSETLCAGSASRRHPGQARRQAGTPAPASKG
jgi:RND family efflux transporter MFP subunit